MNVAGKILRFLSGLEPGLSPGAGIEILNPYRNAATFALCRQFFERYYNDAQKRILILGINPGRHGAGLTGIPFTDPIKLDTICGIKNSLPQKPELSADFIYSMIDAFGGPSLFYKRFYFSSVSPLGFTKDGRNLNYYDDKPLEEMLQPFIIRSLEETISIGMRTDVCFCLGEGKNFKFLQRLNDERGFFRRIVPLAHPRFIMQYKRKQVQAYVGQYLKALKDERGSG
jgi:hypothetical protein